MKIKELLSGINEPKKSDEMRPVIVLYAIRLSWIFMYLFLATIIVYQFITYKKISFPFALLVLQSAVYLFASKALAIKTNKENSKIMILFYISAFLVFIFCVYFVFTAK